MAKLNIAEIQEAMARAAIEPKQQEQVINHLQEVIKELEQDKLQNQTVKVKNEFGVIIMDELKKYSEGGINNDELEFTKNAMAQADALKYESPWQKLGFVKRIIDFNLDKTFVAKQGEILKTITKPEVDELAKKNLPYNYMVILIVGDKAANFEKLSKLGYELIELDINGNKIN